MKKGSISELSASQQAELKALAELRDERIDASDIPEALDRPRSRQGAFYSPAKQPVAVGTDADVMDWFKQHVTAATDYQAEINRVLREHVLNQPRGRMIP